MPHTKNMKGIDRMLMEEKAIKEVVRIKEAMSFADDKNMRELYNRLEVELDNKINAWIIIGLDVTYIQSQSYARLVKLK